MLERSTDLVPNLVRGHKRNGRNLYNRDAKRELVRRCLQPGVSLAATALAHGVNANLLRKWVVTYTGQRPEVEAAAALVAVKALPAPTAPTTTLGEWQLELVVPGGTIRVRGRIDAESLRTVLDCLAARA
jgi:transposase